jgi:hypothetical protein
MKRVLFVVLGAAVLLPAAWLYLREQQDAERKLQDLRRQLEEAEAETNRQIGEADEHLPPTSECNRRRASSGPDRFPGGRAGAARTNQGVLAQGTEAVSAPAAGARILVPRTHRPAPCIFLRPCRFV